MSNIELIKAEIERLENMDYPCDTSEQATGFYDALDRISDFIDSLPEETHKESLQVQETRKENQDSFTDEPKEMSVNEAMAYLEEKIAKASKSWEGIDVDKFLDEIRGREPNDLEEAADKYSEKHGFRVPYDGSNNFYDAVDVKASKEGFVAGAKWMESQMPMPEDTVIFMKGVAEGRRLEREDRNDDNLPRLTKDYYYGG